MLPRETRKRAKEGCAAYLNTYCVTTLGRGQEERKGWRFNGQRRGRPWTLLHKVMQESLREQKHFLCRDSFCPRVSQLFPEVEASHPGERPASRNHFIFVESYGAWAKSTPGLLSHCGSALDRLARRPGRDGTYSSSRECALVQGSVLSRLVPTLGQGRAADSPFYLLCPPLFGFPGTLVWLRGQRGEATRSQQAGQGRRSPFWAGLDVQLLLGPA